MNRANILKGLVGAFVAKRLIRGFVALAAVAAIFKVLRSQPS